MPCAVAQVVGDRPGVIAQPVGVAQRVPGPAGHGAQGQQCAQRVAAEVDLPALPKMLQLDLVDERDARRDEHQ